MVDHHPDTPRNRGDADAPHMSPVLPSEDVRTVLINDIDWGAVFAGAVIALVTQLLLNMIGLGIGLGTIDPASDGSPSAGALGIGAGIWYALSGILAALAGGYAAGRLSGKPRENTASWHGLVSWAVSTLVVLYLLTTAVSSLLGGALGAVGSAAGGLGRTAATVAQAAAPAVAGADNPLPDLEREIRQASGGQDPAQVAATAASVLRGITSDDPAQQAQAREQAAQALAQARGIPVDQARAEVARLETQYRGRVQQTQEQVVQTADEAAGTASRAALLAALSLILGAVAAWFGGRMGRVQPTITPRR